LNASGGPYNNTYGPNEMTWKFSGGNWSLLTTTGQVPATLGPGLVYDGRDGYVLLYGGRLMATGAPTAPVTNQTWSYSAGTWANLSANSTAAPTAVDFANLVYDAADEYVLLYDQLGLSGSPNGTLYTTWSYAAGVWANLTGTAGASPPSFWGAMTYDARDQYVVYFGGVTLSNNLTNATWTFHGGLWKNASLVVSNAPAARMNFGITYDSSHQEVLLYGGVVHLLDFNVSAYSGETWGYANGTWTLLASNGTMYNPQGMVYDAADNETVLLGANLSFASLAVVTWAFSGSFWAVAAPALAPTARTTDTGRAVTLEVTESPNGGNLSYSYSGLPTGCASQDTPALVCVPTAAGSYPVLVRIAGAAGFAATARTTLDVNAAPTIQEFTASSSVGEVGIPLQFAVAASNGTGSLAYAYAGLPTGCLPLNSADLVCIPAASGNYLVSASATDALGVAAVGEISVTVVPALSVVDFAPNHAALDVGQTLSVETALAGGSGPFAFDYVGLPSACSTADQTVLTCQPSATGTFSIAVAAQDQLGGMASARTTVVVNSLPTVVSLVASSSAVRAGDSLQLTATVAGGTGPFVYVYAGLPSGCAASSGPVVNCTSAASGRFAVELKITDSTGATASGSTVLTVSPDTGGRSVAGGGFGGGAFWWGLAVGAVAIALAGVYGGNRLRLARQGEQIVADLRGSASPDESARTPPGDDTGEQEL
ncbi:MAG: hypothetical protein L3K05_04535, partial [Thermoplasmata archaeon]|nr:hypothetical protein [Thermoplasmata archaeon]